jgi:DNA-3-methyladenine glycosylase I
MDDPLEHRRCPWPGLSGIAIYEHYHDTEWGVPERNSRALWEKLVLDGFQAGLSWITILRKREAFRSAFRNFDPELVASFGAADCSRLLADSGIVRSRAKIDAAISGARAYLEMQQRGEELATFLWKFVDGKPLQNRFEHIRQIPSQTPLSLEISKALKARGFQFCGPIIVYAFMQAVGMVNDHLRSCFRHDTIRRMSTSEPAPPARQSRRKRP